MSAASLDRTALARVCSAVAADGIAIEPEFLSPRLVRTLATEAQRRDRAGEFRAARVGRGDRRIERPDIRGDRTAWLGDRANAPVEAALRELLEELRVALN